MGIRHSKSSDLLDGSSWLRTVVQHHQRRRQGVGGFDSFTIEPIPAPVGHTGGESVRIFRVAVAFRNTKGRAQQVHWVVKAAHTTNNSDSDKNNHHKDKSVAVLLHEIRVYTGLLSEVGKYLGGVNNPRARYLLNVPDLVFHERGHRGGKVVRCHLVTEDVSKTKRCVPLKNGQLISGMTLGQFKVLLGTLAQFHAVGIAWTVATRDEAILDLFPYLHCDQMGTVEKRQKHMESYRQLVTWYSKLHPDDRRLQLLDELCKHAKELLDVDLQRDFCDPMGSLCLGSVLPSEVMFQNEQVLPGLFDFCNSNSKGGDSNRVLFNTDDTEAEEEEVEGADATPVCAAVTTCHRVHYGHILRELARFFFIMPEPLVRDTYLILMLQSYCHVLTMTLEMLHVDWHKHFDNMSFHKLVKRFFDHVPQAILHAIDLHMEMTDPDEVETLLKNGTLQQPSPPDTCSKYIPLTAQRVEFLVHLLDPVHKSV